MPRSASGWRSRTWPRSSASIYCSLHHPEDLPIAEADAQFDQLKEKWGELSVALAEIATLNAELE